MEIGKHKAVKIDYTLSDREGKVIDSSQGREPLSYIHGTGSIIPGLEKALEGKKPSETLAVSIPPEQAYGMRDEALKDVVPRNAFDTTETLEVGMRFQASTEQGPRVLTIVGVEGENVTVDSNHPLAGVELHFDVKVVDVRDATHEELDHGHIHGPGAHDH